MRIAEHNRLAQCRGDRPVLTACSGRPQPFVEAMCRLLSNHTVPCIAENGVWMYHPGTNEYIMDPAITIEQREAVHDAARWLATQYGGRGVSQQPGKVASISLYHKDTGFLKSLEAPLREQFAANGWPLRVSSTWLYINCDLEHVSKGTGLDRLMASTGLEKERLAGIGDTMGDLAIRERVSWFACPANAGAEIRAHADYVSPRPEAKGVLDVLTELGLG